MNKTKCIILTGMPGAGKSTVAAKLAEVLERPFIDSDKILEALYGMRLEDITNALSPEQFRDTECQIIRSLNLPGTIIATGGSVIYRDAAMQHLKNLGHIIYLKVPLEAIEERVARNPERGISFGPGQSLADLYRERCNLYEKYADAECDSAAFSPNECAHIILKYVENKANQGAPD